MPQAQANNITIEYDTFGDQQKPAMLLIMGLGAQMIHWDVDFCNQLASEGFYVIRFDNRDVGLSSKMDGESVPELSKMVLDLMSGKTPKVPYSIDDMAADAMGLLDVLGIQQAHICGASMGGMIAQLVACHYPERALSLTSIMSTTGSPDLPKSTAEAQEALSAPRPDSEEEVVKRAQSNALILGSPGFEKDAEFIARRALEAFRRSFYPMGFARQVAAIVVAGDRRVKLQKLTLPSLVIHGTDDPLVPVQGGHDTHENIVGSKLELIEGMGHDLPKGAWNRIISSITNLTLKETEST
ncbi:MAG: pimeloyl-ACP methyl ester carboxylesterase [Flavobacterium sp.]|jgi:pimeloyl-ACP methyl ester carboxylesterase